MDRAKQLLDYHVWANKRVFDRLNEVPGEVLGRELQSVFSSVGAALSHIYVVDNLWLAAMSGDSTDAILAAIPRYEDEVKDASLAIFEARYAQLAERFGAFAAGLEDFEAFADFTHPRLGVLRARYSDIVQHIVNHGTYHRGNITAMLRQLGFAGASTDYVFYLYSLSQ